jgi:N-acetylmuramoyl-L-alanine amidase
VRGTTWTVFGFLAGLLLVSFGCMMPQPGQTLAPNVGTQTVDSADAESEAEGMPPEARGPALPVGPRVTVKDMAAGFGFPAPKESGTRITLRNASRTLVFKTDSRECVYQGVTIWLSAPIAKERGQWTLARADVDGVIEPLLGTVARLPNRGAPVVVLDPGHGGSDTGTNNRRAAEKDLTLDIAQRVQAKLKAHHVDARLTRSRDSTLPLAERSARAREWHAAAFVSIHINSGSRGKASGIETFVVPAAGFSSTAGGSQGRACAGNKHDAGNMALACDIHRAVLSQTGAADRGIRRARFEVLRYAPCPATLVECGFLSNRSEEQRLLQRGYREKLAEGIARGIVAYLP